MDERGLRVKEALDSMTPEQMAALSYLNEPGLKAMADRDRERQAWIKVAIALGAKKETVEGESVHDGWMRLAAATLEAAKRLKDAHP